MARVRRWRTEQNKSGFWSVRTGSRDKRQAVGLGRISEEEAIRARENIQQLESDGMVGNFLHLYKMDVERARCFILGDPASDPTALGENYAQWTLRKYVEEVYGPMRSEKKPATWKAERFRWNRIYPDLGDLRLMDIDPWVVDDHLEGLICVAGARKGLPMGGNGKRLHRTALQACLNYAYKKKHITTMVRLGDIKLEGSTKRVVDKPDPLTLAELERLMESATFPVHRCLFAVGVGQGLRPSEISRLDWPDVDFETRTMRVSGTKTEASRRDIPLTPLAHRELLAWWEQCGKPKEGAIFVYTGRRIKRYRLALIKAASRAGITRRVYPYLLRDSFATIAWEVGVELDTARRIMGHTSNRMLLEVYCRPRAGQLVPKLTKFDFERPG